MREVCSISFLLSVFPFCYLCFLGHGLMFRLLFYRCGSTLPTFFCRIKDDGDGDDEDGDTRVFFVSSLRLGQSTNPPTLKDALSSLFRSFFCTPTLTPTPTHSLTHSHSQSTNYTVLSYVSLRTFLSFSSLYNMCIIIANASLFPFPPSFFLSLSHSRHLTHSRSLTLVVTSLLLSSSSLLGSTPA